MNAKELALSKLNASTKTLGIYIYGISIGMDFRDISKILMSDVGDVIIQLLDSNVFRVIMNPFNDVTKNFTTVTIPLKWLNEVK